MPFLRTTSFAVLLAPLAFAQSVYTLEVIAADQLRPKEGFAEIRGEFIDSQGNIAGVAQAGSRTAGFYWPTADSVKMLTAPGSPRPSDCFPDGIDERGNVWAVCGLMDSADRAPINVIPADPTAAASLGSNPPNTGGDAFQRELRRGTRSRSGASLGTAPVAMPANHCAALADSSNPTLPIKTMLVGTISTPGINGPVTESLPLVPGDVTVTMMTPRGISPDGQTIVGVRSGVTCSEASSVSGQRAVMWRRNNGTWAASVLDQIPISLEVGLCVRNLRLEEANGVNDAGQITGKGTCIDLNGDSRAIAFRITPVEIQRQ